MSPYTLRNTFDSKKLIYFISETNCYSVKLIVCDVKT